MIIHISDKTTKYTLGILLFEIRYNVFDFAKDPESAMYYAANNENTDACHDQADNDMWSPKDLCNYKGLYTIRNIDVYKGDAKPQSTCHNTCLEPSTLYCQINHVYPHRFSKFSGRMLMRGKVIDFCIMLKSDVGMCCVFIYNIPLYDKIIVINQS